jgi:prevent-host-death family protein
MIVKVRAAKANLSKLIAAAEAGAEIIVARNGTPAVKLTPVDQLLIAQALVENMTVVTENRIIGQYGVPIIAA